MTKNPIIDKQINWKDHQSVLEMLLVYTARSALTSGFAVLQTYRIIVPSSAPRYSDILQSRWMSL